MVVVVRWDYWTRTYEKFIVGDAHGATASFWRRLVSVDCILRDCFNNNNNKTGGASLSPSENDVKECKRRRSSSSSSSDRRVPAPFDDVWEKLALWRRWS